MSPSRVLQLLTLLPFQLKGFDTFSLPPYKALSPLLRCYAKAGWYQGSGFFAMLSLFTYQLSQRPVMTWTRIDRSIMGGLVVYVCPRPWTAQLRDVESH
jgi:hypothetical protein